MIQESKSARGIEYVMVGCGLMASLVFIASALLPQDNPDPQLWISLGLCALSLLAGTGYFFLTVLVPRCAGRQPAISTSGQTLTTARILAVLCNLAALIAVLVTW